MYTWFDCGYEQNLIEIKHDEMLNILTITVKDCVATNNDDVKEVMRKLLKAKRGFSPDDPEKFEEVAL